MSDPRIQQWASLRQHPEETWQGGLVRIPAWLSEEGKRPYRPWAALWAARQSGVIHLGPPVPEHEASQAMVLDALLEYGLHASLGRYRPGRIEVADAALAEFLRGELGATGIEVAVVERLDLHEIVLAHMDADFNQGKPRVPGPLEGSGVTVERMRAFAEAAAAFYRAAPWRHLTDVDLIHIEAPQGPSELRVAVVLGMKGTLRGMAFYETAKDYYEFRRMASHAEESSGKIPLFWQVCFNSIESISEGDADLWMEHSLETAGDQAYPVLLRYGSDMSLRRAGRDELTHAEAWLRALAATSEAEIDSGRWHKDVVTHDGPTRVTLAIPDLLKPPSPSMWIKRGLSPDPRSAERVMADIGRFLAQNPPATEQELRATLEQRFTGSSLDELSTPPSTPMEQAQDLCYQAFATFGRRRLQLARQALEIWPDCADAWGILAEHAATVESQLECYAQGVAAGERALGHEAFEQHRGHFWSVIETRPYMRARFGLARTFETHGRLEEAVVHYQELLELNPGDHLGVRYLLAPRLMQMGRDRDAARLLQQYDDPSPTWTYSRALIAFRLSGRSAAAERELRAALRSNPQVPRFLLSDEEPRLPDSFTPGSVEEAVVCAHELKPAFAATDGAQAWLAEAAAKRDRELRARQREQLRKKRRRGKR